MFGLHLTRLRWPQNRRDQPLDSGGRPTSGSRSGARRCTIRVDYIQSLREGGIIKLLPRNKSAIRRPSFKTGYSTVEAVRLEKTKRLSLLNQDTRLDKHPRTWIASAP